MKINWLLFGSLLFSVSAWSQTCKNIDECRDKSKDYSHLPQRLEERKMLCEIAPFEGCLEQVIEEANEILSCSKSARRKQEMIEYDSKFLSAMIEDHGSQSVPQHIQQTFKKLTLAADELSKKTFPWKLTSYKASFINAHAGAEAHIMASGGLWASESQLQNDEIAAILAHETAHIIQDHSLKLGCLSLEWTGTHLSIKDSMILFREDFSVSTDRGKAWAQLSNKIEYEADAVATKILKQAKFDPLAMARVLKKLKLKAEGGFSSGSHPELDDRIEAATKRAKEISK